MTAHDSWTVALMGKDVYNDGTLVSPRVKGLNFVGASLIEVDTINGWVTVAFAGGGGGGSPLTTKGDIYAYSSADTRLPVGTSGQVLSANPATATGLQWINPPSSTDSDAIHDNVAGEISSITLKASPTGSDLILIEDAAASNAKKRATLTSVLALASANDANAIHDNVAAEISAVTEKVTPVGADMVLIEDSAAANVKKRATLSAIAALAADATAIHDNVSGEFAGVTAKASPVGGDLLLIEDSAAGNAKKRVTLTAVAGLANDANAIHDNVAGEISAVTAKATPVGADLVLIEDSAAANAKKRVTLTAIAALAADATAIHANVAGEIAGVTSKPTPTGADLLLIEDAAAGNAKKSVTLTSISALANDGAAIHDNVSGEIAAVTLKGTPANNDLVLIEDSAASNVKKRVTVASIVGLASTTDSDAIHDNVSGEFAAVTSKVTPASADLLLIEDSAASNAKKRITIASILASAPVQSVFSRTGAVVSAVGDYVASQVNNDSTVVGATVAAALNTLNTAIGSLVPTSRTVTAGAGLTGGGSLASNRTFDVAAHADGSIIVNANDVQVGVLATDTQHGIRGGGDRHAVATPSVNGFMSAADKVKSDAIVFGAAGQVPYSTGSGFTSETAFSYTAASNRLTVDGPVRANQIEIYESGALSEDLWEIINSTSGVLSVRTRTDADGSGNNALELERDGTLISRVQALTQYGVAEMADSYSAEVDTADTPAASSILRSATGTAVALTAGFSYEFEVSVQTHIAGVGYEAGRYLVSAQRQTAGDAELLEVLSSGAATLSGLDMQFAANTSTDQITCAPTVGLETPHRKVRWSVRMVRRTPIVTEDT